MLNKIILLWLIAFSCIASTVVNAVPWRMLAVVEENASRVGFYQPHTGKSLGGVYVGYFPHEIAITRDGRTAYVSNFGIQNYETGAGVPGASISVIDIPNRTEKYRLYTFDALAHKTYAQIDGAPHGLQLRPPLENQLYVNVEKGSKILVYDLKSNTLIKQFPVSGNIHNFLFSPDGNTLWLMAGPEGVMRMDPDSGKLTGKINLSSPVRGLTYSSDSRHLIAAASNQVALIDPMRLSIEKRFNNLGVGQLFYSAMTPDGKYLITPAAFDNQILIIEVASGKVIQRIVTGLNPIRVIVGSSGKYAYVSNATDKRITQINLVNFKTSDIYTQSGPASMAFLDYIPKNKHRQLILGVALPLSGDDGSKGSEMMRGYEYWRTLVQRKGGILLNKQAYNVKIIYLDTQSDKANVERLTNELLKHYHVHGLLATYGQEAYNLEKQIAIKNRVPITPGLGSERRWEPSEIASGQDYFVTSNAYSRQFYETYHVKATHLAAAATALGIVLQQALLDPQDKLDYQKLTNNLAQNQFKIFYQY